MTRRPLTIVTLTLLAVVAGWKMRPTQEPAKAQDRPRPGGAAGRGAAPLVAEGYTIEPETVRQTVPSLGTLRPNESVTVVAESSRRVVAVHFEEGAEVRKGDLLFKLDDAALRADLLRLEGRHGLAVATEARQADLVKQKLVSTQDYDRARSELQAIEGEMEVLKVQLAQTEIRAPFAGRVGLRRVSDGAYVSPNTVLTTLQDVSQLKLDFTLPERYAADVRKGQSFTFKVEGRADGYTGRVVAIDPAIDTATRSLLVRGVVPNPGGRLTAGASAAVEFEVQSAEGVLIPARALVPSIKGHSVFVLRDGKAAEQEVMIGVRTSDKVQILQGLKKGDVLLTSNLLRLRAGVPVRLEARVD
jgi:membrane fusion protein (multidrug efflux system)